MITNVLKWWIPVQLLGCLKKAPTTPERCFPWPQSLQHKRLGVQGLTFHVEGGAGSPFRLEDKHSSSYIHPQTFCILWVSLLLHLVFWADFSGWHEEMFVYFDLYHQRALVLLCFHKILRFGPESEACWKGSHFCRWWESFSFEQKRAKKIQSTQSQHASADKVERGHCLLVVFSTDCTRWAIWNRAVLQQTKRDLISVELYYESW